MGTKIITDWAYARSVAGWAMSWRVFFGGLPKLAIVCGRCGAGSRSRAKQSANHRVYVTCAHCATVNVVRRIPGD